MPAKQPKSLGGRPKTTRMEMLRSRSFAIGVSVATLAHWENDGCDIEDDDSVKTHVAKLQKKPKTINPEYYTPAAQLEETPDIAFLKDQLLRTQDDKDAKRIKTQIDGLLSAQKLEVLNQSYISMEEVKAAYIKLGSVIRAGIMRLQADLPPVLEGRSPAEMAKRIGEAADKLLTELSSNAAEVWGGDD
jgi:hypothetical protein